MEKENQTENQNKNERVTATMQTSPEFEKVRIGEGLYPCECTQVKPVKDGTYGARIAVVCRILENGAELANVVYKKLTPNSAATKVVQAFGYEFVDGKEFDFSELVGKKATALVEDYDYKDKDGNEKVASTISKIKPMVQPGKPGKEGNEGKEGKEGKESPGQKKIETEGVK